MNTTDETGNSNCRRNQAPLPTPATKAGNSNCRSPGQIVVALHFFGCRLTTSAVPLRISGTKFLGTLSCFRSNEPVSQAHLGLVRGCRGCFVLGYEDKQSSQPTCMNAIPPMNLRVATKAKPFRLCPVMGYAVSPLYSSLMEIQFAIRSYQGHKNDISRIASIRPLNNLTLKLNGRVVSALAPLFDEAQCLLASTTCGVCGNHG